MLTTKVFAKNEKNRTNTNRGRFSFTLINEENKNINPQSEMLSIILR